MPAAIGSHAGFEVTDGAVGERRSLLKSECAGRKLPRGQLLLGARREMAHHALHDFLLDRIEQASHVRVRTDLRDRQRDEPLGRVVPESCLLEQVLEGICIAVALRQEVREVEEFLHSGGHG